MLPPKLTAALEAGEPVVGIGLISGTSADGIDAVALEIRRDGARLHLQQLAFNSTPYPEEVRAALFRCFADEAAVSEVCLLNARLGELFAEAAAAVAPRGRC